jgi:5-methylthioadenosine/S-adenosylhomocysteine deaminase
VLLRATDFNLWPVHDPVSSVVMQAETGNVDSVMIAGKWHKRGGRLQNIDLAPIRARLAESGTRILAALGWPDGHKEFSA